MAQVIPTLLPLKYDDTNQEQAWTDCIEHVEDALMAFSITEDSKRLALRFYGEKIERDQDFDTEDSNRSHRADIQINQGSPDAYFIEKTNEVFKRHKFRMLAQELDETTNIYVTRLRTQGAKYNFA
ncbi:hypothetical protein Pcinc_003989 [Petrolisthes cinctipes]|uniref:Uncharacterized protein n=1 Tax=Petrolisthes cinctipes TaxID=88211 RepID=A0AAE1GFB5_PETCI|nr:hypothetical protein Pcinc_003989 [Petrolisthes cinctipes]